MLGGQGALPLHYTEQIIAREQIKRDRAAREFFDMFSNRATALFYAAWKKYRLPFHYELDRDERYLPLLLALAGVADDDTRNSLQSGDGALFDESDCRLRAGRAASAGIGGLFATHAVRVLQGAGCASSSSSANGTTCHATS